MNPKLKKLIKEYERVSEMGRKNRDCRWMVYQAIRDVLDYEWKCWDGKSPLHINLTPYNFIPTIMDKNSVQTREEWEKFCRDKFAITFEY